MITDDNFKTQKDQIWHGSRSPFYRTTKLKPLFMSDDEINKERIEFASLNELVKLVHTVATIIWVYH